MQCIITFSVWTSFAKTIWVRVGFAWVSWLDVFLWDQNAWILLSYIVPGHIHAWLQSFLLQSPHTFGSPIKEEWVKSLLFSGSLTWSRVCPRRWRCPPRCRQPHAWRTPPSLPVGSPEMWKVAYKNLTISNHFMKLRIYATQLAIWITSDMESLIKIYPTLANWLLV